MEKEHSSKCVLFVRNESAILDCYKKTKEYETFAKKSRSDITTAEPGVLLESIKTHLKH